MQNALKTNLLSYSFLLLAQCMVGVCIVGTKSILTTIPAMAILTIRFGIGFLFLLAMHVMLERDQLNTLKKLTNTDWLLIIAQALCAGLLFNVFLLAGLHYTSASVAGIITSALPAIIAVFSLCFLKERLTKFTLGCVLFSVLGLIIINYHNVSSLQSANVMGELLILLALLPEAAYYIISKRHKNTLPVFLLSALMNGINVPLFFIILVLTDSHMTYTISATQWGLLVIIGIGSALFYVFWLLGSKHIHASAAGLTTAFMPLATLILAFIFLGEKISVYQAIGMVLVILAIGFNAMKNREGYNKIIHLTPSH